MKRRHAKQNMVRAMTVSQLQEDSDHADRGTAEPSLGPSVAGLVSPEPDTGGSAALSGGGGARPLPREPLNIRCMKLSLRFALVFFTSAD